MEPFKSLLRVVVFILGWLPFLVFFSIISFMFLTDFQNPVDGYFVSLILRACLMLIAGAFFSQLLVLGSLLLWVLTQRRRSEPISEVIHFLEALPIVEIAIFSLGIFFTKPEFGDWVTLLCVFMMASTFGYWLEFLNGPIRNLFVFARFHQVKRRTINRVLAPFYFKTFIDYFFLVLKRFLMPLVFILVVMDFRFIVPRLVQAGLSYQALVLFLSLIISLHMLSYRQREML